MSKIEINHALLHYVEQGRGPPLVLIHGSASDFRTWTHQLEAFSPAYRVISYSRRYHWPNQSIPENGDYSMAEQLEDLQTILTALRAEPAHLVAHSYGAFLALLLAIREPQLVQTLVLAEPPIITLFTSNPPRAAELLKLFVRHPLIAAAIIKFGATGIAPANAAAKRGDMTRAMTIFGQAVLGRKAFRELSAERREQVWVNSFRAEFLGSGFLPLKAEDLRNVRAPTLVITGEHSPRLFHHFDDAIAKLLPCAIKADISGASHIIHEDNPTEFNTAVLSFLASQPVDAGTRLR